MEVRANISRSKVAKYLLCWNFILVFLPSLLLAFTWKWYTVIFGIVYLYAFAVKFTNRQSRAIDYYIVDGFLHVNYGIWFLKRKKIPLSKITNINRSQGPLMRWCDIWAVQVQTAGTSECEAMLIGITNMKTFQEAILVKEKDIFNF